MKRILASTLALVAFAASSADAWASTHACIAARDATSLEVAAVQQQLMVAALTCQDTPRYNQFVTSYQPELQASDANLMAFFKHRGQGSAGYHAFKTRLANEASLRSSHSPEGYCQAANSAFDDALSGNKSLDIFVAAQPMAFRMPYSVCTGSDVVTAQHHKHHKTMRVSEEVSPAQE
jgi:hypothetical protein